MVKQKVYCGHDIPVADCVEHWPLMCEVTGYTIERRAIEWALGDDTGTSSQTLAAYMLGINSVNGCRGNGRSYPPGDADDRGRCIRLLKLIPEWLPRLPELAEANPGGCHDGTSKPIKQSWAYQIPLILKEGGF